MPAENMDINRDGRDTKLKTSPGPWNRSRVDGHVRLASKRCYIAEVLNSCTLEYVHRVPSRWPSCLPTHPPAHPPRIATTWPSRRLVAATDEWLPPGRSSTRPPKPEHADEPGTLHNNSSCGGTFYLEPTPWVSQKRRVLLIHHDMADRKSVV